MGQFPPERPDFSRFYGHRRSERVMFQAVGKGGWMKDVLLLYIAVREGVSRE